MYSLTVSAAKDYIRKILDELTSVEDIGMLVLPDAVDLHKLVEGFLVESVVKVHSEAPSLLIDGLSGVKGIDFSAEINDGVVEIEMLKDTLRVASVKVSDSPFVVTELIPEDSAIARAQLNEYVRGIADDPRVVLAKKWAGDYLPVLRYYSTTKEKIYIDELQAKTAEALLEEGEKGNYVIVDVEYVPYPIIEETVVLISPRLENAVLNELAAMVLDALSMSEKAALYREKSKSYMS